MSFVRVVETRCRRRNRAVRINGDVPGSVPSIEERRP